MQLYGEGWKRFTHTGDLLTLKGERTQTGEVKQEGYHRMERYSGRFERNITLPIPVQADTAKATYRDGMLEIKIAAV